MGVGVYIFTSQVLINQRDDKHLTEEIKMTVKNKVQELVIRVFYVSEFSTR